MQRFMLGLDAVLRRHRRLVLVAWLVVLVGAVPFAMRQSEELTGGGFSIPGSGSQAVRDALDEHFPGGDQASLAVVLVPQEGATPAQVRAFVDRVDRAAARQDGVELTPAVARQADRAAAGGEPLVLPLAASVGDDEATDVAVELREALGVGQPAGAVEPHLVGQGALWAGLQELTKQDLEAAETTGFPIVFLILLAVFGGLVAASLPLLLGFVSVLVTGALIFVLSRQMEMSVFVTNMASMVGIGVAVDYSLFVLARYREELAKGAGAERARAVALATSGTAVAFSGITVMVSLAGLFLIENQALRSMALGSILVVAVSVLASATLLPVLIATFGRRAHEQGRIVGLLARAVANRRRGRPGATRPDYVAPPGFWQRWTDRVMGKPVRAVVLAAGVLLLLAAPALDLKSGEGALDQFPAGNETRRGFEAAASVTGPGAAAPVEIVATTRRGSADEAQNAAAVRDLTARLRQERLVADVAPPVAGRDGRSVLVTATLRADGESEAAKGLVERLRTAVAADPDLRPLRVDVGGTTAQQLDFADQVNGSMWKVVLFVLALSFLVLMVLLRSIVLPLKAIVVNLLSVGASLGVLVVVFQWGWFDWLPGIESTGTIDTLTPPLVLAVVFGLSMDYEVFLLARIKERWEATGDTRLAVAEGLASSARTITSAALIMVAVFAVFVGTGVPSIKQLGLGNAVAIAVDATLVRLVLVPAAMELLGDRNWWLPRPLRRILPRTDLETAPASAG